jgi:hypothetical protein
MRARPVSTPAPPHGNTAVGRHFEEVGAAPPMPLGELAWTLLGLATGLDVQAYVDPEAAPEGSRGTAVSPLLGGG